MRKSNYSRGILALILVGGYYLWHNRFRIQRALQAKGIRPVNLSLNTRNLRDAAASGFSKAIGS